jgi:agmatine deiminase
VKRRPIGMGAAGEDKRVTVGLVQTAVSDDVPANLKNNLARVKGAASKGAKIVCLQELFRTRYFPQYEKKDFTALSETLPGESTAAFSELARKLEIVVIVPVFERSGEGKYYNSAVVIDADGKLLETYRKVHIPHDPLFYEKDYFTPGDKGYVVHRTRYAAFSVLICYDQWFPEAARICSLGGAQILFYPTAIGWIKGHDSTDGDWHGAWETIQRSHAIANGVHVASVNRVGEEGELKFWGSSFVSDPFGEVLKRASSENEATVVAELDLSRNVRIQEGWGFLRNRRPDTYGPLISKKA